MKKYGYIKTNGEFLVEPRFLKAGPFYGDYARADLSYRDATSPAEAGCSVDRNGNVVPIRNLSVFSRFSEGLGHISESTSSGKKGIVDAQGTVVVPCHYRSSNNFWRGRAIVSALRPGAKGDRTWDYEFVVIDRSGQELRRTGLTGTIASDWSDGLAACRPEYGDDRRFCYVDHGGEIIVRAPEGIGYDFSEGLATYSHTEDGEYYTGFFDKKGNIAIAPHFQFANKFSEGLAPVQQDDRYFFINKDGERVISLPEDCSHISSFSRGLAAVQLGGEKKPDEFGHLKTVGGSWGYIDRTGKLVITPRFVADWYSGEFTEDGLACVSEIIDNQLRCGYIDRTGKYVIQPIYLDGTHFSSGLAAVQVGASGFVREDWHDWFNTEEYPSRSDALAEFFKAYPVLGMRKEEIHALLGEGDEKEYSGERGKVESYALTTWWCGHGCSSFELLYEDNRVAGWRRASLNDTPAFQREREKTYPE